MALSNTQYDAIMRTYNERQLQNRRLAQKRREEVLAKTPELTRIEEEIASSSVEAAKLLLTGDDQAIAELHQTIDGLRKEKEALLRSLGYPVDFLAETYTCSDCKDTGYIGQEPCHCFVQASINLRYQQSHLMNVIQEAGFEHFSLDYYSPDITDPATNVSSYTFAQHALKVCRNFADNFESEHKNLCLYGDPGLGKTFLSNCIAKELLDKGYSVVYFSASHLFDLLAKYTFEKQTESIDYENLYNCDLLIIDDLGTELPNAFTKSQFFMCLNERLLRKKSTIISTNLELPQLTEIYSERTASRINSQFQMLKFYGEDIRLLKKRNF